MFSGQTDRVRHALSFRLAVWYLGIFAASSAALMGLTYALLASSLHQRDHDTVRELVLRYARIYARGGIDAVDRSVYADRVAGRYEPFFLRIARGRSTVLYLPLPEEWGTLDVTALDEAALAAGEWAEVSVGPDEVPLDVSGVRLPDGTEMQVGKSSRMRHEALARFRAGALTILALVLVVGLAGGAVLTHSALAPLRSLTATIQRILRTGNMETRVPVRRSPDPLDALAALFNELLGRLDRLISGMRQTLDNAAHDLRTPLTRARSRLESALQGPQDPAAYRATIEETIEEIDRIAGMLTTLMDISEAQTGAMRLQRQSVRVATLFEETLDLYGDAAEARGITLTTDTAPDLVLEADYNRMRQVLANLVDNAIKYTPRGGRIELRARTLSDGVVLQVADNGIGIPADELPRIWDRLFRGDRSRTQKGLGLGLSVVKAIVEAHHGSVSAESALGKGTTFTLRFPKAGTPFTDVMTA